MKAKLFFFFFFNWIMFYHGYQNKRILYTDISVFSVIPLFVDVTALFHLVLLYIYFVLFFK